jgi:hypothetical protein
MSTAAAAVLIALIVVGLPILAMATIGVIVALKMVNEDEGE